MHAEDGVALVVFVVVERLELQRIQLARNLTKLFERLLASHVVTCLISKLQQHLCIVDLGGETAHHVEQPLVAGETPADRAGLVLVIP